MIYNDSTLLDALPEGEADGMMRDCLTHADELSRDGHLIESRMLAGAEKAKSVRIRNGRLSATDGPFTEPRQCAPKPAIQIERVDRAIALCIGAVDQNRLDVDDRRAVDGLDRSDPQPGSRDLAHGHAM